VLDPTLRTVTNITFDENPEANLWNKHYVGEKSGYKSNVQEFNKKKRFTVYPTT